MILHSFIVTDVTRLGLIIETHLPGLLKHHVILLDAPMGAGKTTFVSALATLMGTMITPSSPTFSIINEYPLANPFMGYRKIIHADLYRIESTDELLHTGIEDYLYDPSLLVLIEWPALIESLLIPPFTRLHIETGEHHIRKFVYLESKTVK